jgi:hypothetical protein
MGPGVLPATATVTGLFLAIFDGCLQVVLADVAEKAAVAPVDGRQQRDVGCQRIIVGSRWHLLLRKRLDGCLGLDLAGVCFGQGALRLAQLPVTRL